MTYEKKPESYFNNAWAAAFDAFELYALYSRFFRQISGNLFYGSIILLPVTFLFYRLKVSKVKVWRVVLEAAGLLMVEYLFMVLAGLALVYYDLIPLA